MHYREEDPEGFPHRLVQKTLKYKVEDGFGGRSASYFQLTAALSDSADVASQMEDVHLQSKYTLFSNPDKDSWFFTDFVPNGKPVLSLFLSLSLLRVQFVYFRLYFPDYSQYIVKQSDPFFATTTVVNGETPDSKVHYTILWLPTVRF